MEQWAIIDFFQLMSSDFWTWFLLPVLASPANSRFPFLGVAYHIYQCIGDSFPIGALLSITAGRPVTWCSGAEHC